MDAKETILSTEELEKWRILENEEKELPNVPKGKKPEKADMDKIREFRKRKKDFLQALSAEKQALLSGGAKQGNSQTERGTGEDKLRALHRSRVEALKEFRIMDENGVACELVDIGINVQSRFKKHEIEEQFERSFAAGTTRVILTGCSLKSSQDGITLCEKWYSTSKSQDGKFPVGGFHSTAPLRVYATVGVHPHDAKTIATETGVDTSAIEKLRALAASPYCVSLGECGLDYDRMFSPMDVQKHAFDAQVALAVELQRPLFLHLRERDSDKGEPLGALEHATEILAKYDNKIDPSKVCIHCFTGNKDDLQALTSKGYFIGLTGYIGMKSRPVETGTLEAIADPSVLSLDRLMIETDSPFMRPAKEYFPDATGFRKAKNNEPGALPAVCRSVASFLHGGAFQAREVANRTTSNAMSFFQLDQADLAIRTQYS